MDKICPICNNTFESKRSDSICCSKICGTKLWKHKNKEHIKKYKKEYSKTDKAKKNQKIRSARWYNKNHDGNKKSYDKICKNCSIKFIANRSDKIFCSHKCSNDYWKSNNKKHIKEYNEKNREKKNKQNKEWKKDNPEKILNQKHKRRALYKETDITDKWLKKLREGSIYCHLCNEKMNEILNSPKKKNLDHIVPLNIDGTHSMDNVRYICSDCNLRRPKNGEDLLEEL